MVKIISILVFAILVLLFPPAILALISQDAVPGDPRYPIKRKLEDGILMLAAVNPNLKAAFTVVRSERRFKEAASIIGKGENPTDILDELVVQTDAAAYQIKEIGDTQQKKQLVVQLVSSIDKYKTELEALKKTQPGAAVSSPRPLQLTGTPFPSPAKTNNGSPAPVPVPASGQNQKQLDDAIARLEEIERKLKEEEQRLKALQAAQDEGTKQSPTPSASAAGQPSPTQSSTPTPSPGTAGQTRLPDGQARPDAGAPSPRAATPTPTPTPIPTPSLSQTPTPTPQPTAVPTQRPAPTPTPQVVCYDNYPPDRPSAPPSSSWEYYWKADCSDGCERNSECPKNYSDGYIDPDTSNWCYASRCYQLRTRSSP